MALEIRPTTFEDLPALGRFLARGFGLPEGVEALAADVLAWKYLESPPWGLGCGSLVAVDEAGELVGHLGFTRTAWRQAGSPETVSTLHMLDWLASPHHKGVGARLMRRANAEVSTQYGLGGSTAARTVANRAGYRVREPVPVFRRVLRSTWRLRESGDRLWRRTLPAARDAIRAGLDRDLQTNPSLSVFRVEGFGAEVEDLVGRVEPPLMFSDRGSARLNAVLSYPRGGPIGHRVNWEGEMAGFAVTNVVASGRVKIGKVVELFLENREVSVWASAFAALARDLKRRGADVAIACGGTAWEAEALRRAGFRRAYDLEFVIRDREGLLPGSIPTHVTYLEADYATLA